jgi:pullulanase
MNPDGTWSNASGCGNETASERAMMRKFIVESVVYWATEYHIDGFRFDLMGVHDIETMNAVRLALDKVDPTICIYGEGWTAGPSVYPEEKRALKKNAKQLDRIAVFSDDIRDALKGSWQHPEIPGFVSGVDSLEESVKFGVVGSIQHPQIDYSRLIYSKEPYVNDPTQVISYVSCHDDLCLADKLRSSKPLGATNDEICDSTNWLKPLFLLLRAFLLFMPEKNCSEQKKGSQFLSVARFHQPINWDNKTVFQDLYQYYKGLIALRKAHPAFRLGTQENVQQYLHFLDGEFPM